MHIHSEAISPRIGGHKVALEQTLVNVISGRFTQSLVKLDEHPHYWTK